MRRRDKRRKVNERREREREGVNVQAVTRPPRVQANLQAPERIIAPERPPRERDEGIETKDFGGNY